MNDHELLRGYASDGSQADFTQIVERHLNLVYSASRRQVRDAHLAQDVTQQVFTLLARRAGRLGPDTILPAWLYRTARHVASESLRREGRRQRREQLAAEAMNLSTPDATWRQIEPFLDEAMGGLSATDHDAVVLRYFENKNLKEVGAALGLSEDAAQKRVTRALDKLRTKLTRRGVTLSAPMLAAAIMGGAILSSPASLVAPAVATAAVKAAAATTSTATLLKATLKYMAWTKLKVTVVVGAGVLLVAGTAIVMVSSRSTSDSLAARVEQILRQKMMPSKGQWNAGMDELWSLGPDIIPCLAAQARLKDSLLSKGYVRLWKAMPAAPRRYLREPVNRAELRQTAMHAIAEFGPLAVRRAAPQVIDGLTETHNNYAAKGLRWLLPESAQARGIFERGLAGTNANWPEPLVFLRADGLISSLWPKIPEVVPLLTNLLGNAGVADYAAHGLGLVGPDAAPAIPALIQTVDLGAAGPFPDAEAARFYTAEAYSNPLGWYLAKIRQDDKGMNHNRALAALALGRIGVATPEVCAFLARAWNAPDAWVRQNAAEAIALLRPPITNDLPELLDGLADRDNAALEKKLAAIGKLAPARRDALATLRELTQPNRIRDLVQDPDCKIVGSSVDDLVVAAKMAICRIDPREGRVFLPEIANRIGRWWDPVEFLVEPSLLSNDAVRAAEPLLEQPDVARQSMAAYVILNHDREHSEALAVLRRNKSTGNLNDRLLAGRLLFKSLGETDGLCALIEEGFKSPESYIGQTAGLLADQIGDAVLPAVPAFKTALWHRDRAVREHAGRLILKLAPQELPINESK